MAEWTGKTLGRVRIEKLIARGGMAEVYLGTHLTLNRPVAVKMLLGYLEDQRETLQRFQREARLVAGLRHPNIVQIFDFDVLEGLPYLVMEYLPGPALSAYLDMLQPRGLRLPPQTVARLVNHLASALEYAHGRGVVHRDVKPANILLHSKGGPVGLDRSLPDDVEPILTDFGLSRLLNNPALTASGLIAGTPAYMSPEQARGEAVDSRSDVYSLGIVLYELLAGEVPFGAEATLGVLHKHIHEQPPRIPYLPADQQAVLDRALAKNPAERYQTAGQLAAEFQATISSTLPLAARSSEVPTTPPTRLLPRPRPRLSWLVPAAALGLAVLAGVWLLRPTLPALPAAGQAETASPAASPTPGPPAAMPTTDIDTPLGVLSFSDLGLAALNQAVLDVSGLEPPPPGGRYEAWLLADEIRRSLGVLTVDAAGSGHLTFIDPQDRNLIGIYEALEITLEPDPDASPNPSDRVAYSSVFPPQALQHIRHLLASMADTPGQIGLVPGLVAASGKVDQTALAMLAAYDAGDLAGARRQAEALYNLIVGDQDPTYGDLDGDGQVSDPGDGYGLLLNGDHAGYIEGVNSHTAYAAGSPDSTASIQLHAMHVEICIQNLEAWTPQLRDLARSILEGGEDPSVREAILQAVSLAGRMLHGIDRNGDERLDPLPGEGGVETASQHAYYMAVQSVYAGADRMAPAAPPQATPAHDMPGSSYDG